MALSLTFPTGGALVTGGTGRVGEGVVRRLADAGVPLVFTYLGRKDAAAALEAELRDAGHDVTAQQMSMEDVTSIRAALQKVVDSHGRLHTVACGSGVPVTFNRLSDFDVADVEKFMWGDALGYFRIFHTAMPFLKAGGGGSLTTCTTMAFRRYIAFDGISPLSKGSVEALVRQTAAEEAEHGIRANAVAIGWVGPKTMDEYRAQFPANPPRDAKTQEEMAHVLMRQIIDTVPLQRAATLAEAGNLFAFLASDQAAYITGQSIALDGGTTL